MEHVQDLQNLNYFKLTYHYVLDSAVKNGVAVSYTPSADKLADPFTEALIGETFETLLAAVNIKSIVRWLWMGVLDDEKARIPGGI